MVLYAKAGSETKELAVSSREYHTYLLFELKEADKQTVLVSAKEGSLILSDIIFE